MSQITVVRCPTQHPNLIQMLYAGHTKMGFDELYVVQRLTETYMETALLCPNRYFDKNVSSIDQRPLRRLNNLSVK